MKPAQSIAVVREGRGNLFRAANERLAEPADGGGHVPAADVGESAVGLDARYQGGHGQVFAVAERHCGFGVGKEGGAIGHQDLVRWTEMLSGRLGRTLGSDQDCIA